MHMIALNGLGMQQPSVMSGDVINRAFDDSSRFLTQRHSRSAPRAVLKFVPPMIRSEARRTRLVVMSIDGAALVAV
jgi:hypothetical protein